MTHGSLFSGGGGFDLVAQWAGWSNMFNCEINPFCRTILKYHFPDAEQYSDIRTTDFSIWRGRIDVLSGGFPCQPFSQAGKRKGTDDDRYLWPEMLRAIREVRPRWVVGENVLGIVNWSKGLVFEQVCADLEAEGYEVQPFVLPACGVGAPHRRDRVWFVAHSDRCADLRGPAKDEGTSAKERLSERDTFRKPDKSNYLWGDTNLTSDACNNRCGKRSYEPQLVKECESSSDYCIGCQNGIVADTSVTELQGSKQYRSIESKRSFQTQSGQPCRPVCGKWQDFPTQSPVCSRDDGVSYGLVGITFSKWRQESIKLYGNAIVPQVALQIFETINEITCRKAIP